MALAYIIDGGLNDPPGAGIELYDTFGAVRRSYAQAQEWTGVPVSRLLSWELDRPSEHRQVGAIRQTAIVLGIADVLAGLGVRPDVVAGLSLGGMIGAALVGSISRPDLFAVLTRLRDVQAPPGPAQGVASLFVPAGLEPQQYVGGFPEGVYLAADMGTVSGGLTRMLLLSGRRDALDVLASQLDDPGALRIPADLTTAFHSPLLSYVCDFIEPVIVRTAFADPQVPLCGGLAPGEYTDASQVQDMFRRNHVEPVSIPRLFDCLEQHDTELSFLIGPAMADVFLGAAEHAVVHIENPSHLSEALGAIQEFGLQLST